MRAHEFITEAKTVDFQGLTLKTSENNHELMIDALDDWGNKVLGHVTFYKGDGRELDPQDLWVNEKYQGQGIARVMYDYVKKLGYTIVRSWDQTPAGAGFWNKHRGEDVRVWEAFNNPYKTKTEKSEYGDVDVLARLPDGTNLSIMFNHEGDNEWQVEFYRDNSQEVTGQGDAQRIFATVLAAIQKFVKKYQPDVIKFSAEKSNNSDSRSSLYDRLVSRFAQQLGYNDYSEEYMSSTMYELSRQSQGVAERKKSRRKKSSRSSRYSGYFFPGYAYYSSGDSGEGGGDGGGGESRSSMAGGNAKKQAVRRIQKMLNDRFDANLDIDGVMGPLTQKSINRFMSGARPGAADDPDRTTAVQGGQQKNSSQAEEQLDELSFLGSECTKDCSGHRAGYDWSKRQGLRQANSWSPSFNKGAGLAAAGK
jgi:hypothetical protein